MNPKEFENMLVKSNEGIKSKSINLAMSKNEIESHSQMVNQALHEEYQKNLKYQLKPEDYNIFF